MSCKYCNINNYSKAKMARIIYTHETDASLYEAHGLVQNDENRYFEREHVLFCCPICGETFN